MGRLIDVDVLKKHYAWWNNEEKEMFDAIVDAQPTAFDLERVVQELEEQIDSNRGWEDEDFFAGETNGFEVAIKIVKAGGIDERD
jgi:hypothetical protein